MKKQSKATPSSDGRRGKDKETFGRSSTFGNGANTNAPHPNNELTKQGVAEPTVCAPKEDLTGPSVSKKGIPGLIAELLEAQRNCEVELLGKTTLRRMISAAFDASDPLHSRYTFAECFGAKWSLEDNPNEGDEDVYVYYHPKTNETIMTNIEGDYGGLAGSSAGFEGKLTQQDIADVKTTTETAERSKKSKRPSTPNK
jgi:hypothetical protein